MQLDTLPKHPFQREPQPGGGAVGPVFYLAEDDQKRLTWEHLETVRLKRLGIPNRYSRHLGRDMSFLQPGQDRDRSRSPERRQGPAKGSMGTGVSLAPDDRPKASGSNSIAPFYTMAKPTCGFFFSRETDNKKRKTGIPPSDLVKWRSFAQ